MEIGILAYGAYIPRRRLARKSVADANACRPLRRVSMVAATRTRTPKSRSTTAMAEYHSVM